jgi:hypothetical protein
MFISTIESLQLDESNKGEGILGAVFLVQVNEKKKDTERPTQTVRLCMHRLYNNNNNNSINTVIMRF